jgi:RimJ/RimL family protein N-acetyltransferase
MAMSGVDGDMGAGPAVLKTLTEGFDVAGPRLCWSFFAGDRDAASYPDFAARHAVETRRHCGYPPRNREVGAPELTTLQTERLTLIPSSAADCADFMALERDPEVMRFLNGGAVDHDKIDPGTAPFLMPRGTEPHVWTARRVSDAAFVGWFCLAPDSATEAEIGYRLCREMWGQGLASEGAAALLDWGFRHGGYDRVVASTMAINHGSRRVMEKLGMEYAYTDFPDFSTPIPGAEEGEVCYELSRSSWAGPASRPRPGLVGLE